MCYDKGMKKGRAGVDPAGKIVPKNNKCQKKRHLLHRKIRFVDNFQKNFFYPRLKEKTAEIAEKGFTAGFFFAII